MSARNTRCGASAVVKAAALHTTRFGIVAFNKTSGDASDPVSSLLLEPHYTAALK
jgi:hypothetical protein